MLIRILCWYLLIGWIVNEVQGIIMGWLLRGLDEDFAGKIIGYVADDVNLAGWILTLVAYLISVILWPVVTVIRIVKAIRILKDMSGE